MRTKLTLNLIAFSALSVTFFSCQKQNVQPASLQNINIESAQNSIQKNSPAQLVSGVYNVVGTRKFYFGAVSDSVLVIVEDLSVYSPKTIAPYSGSFLKVTCDFAGLGNNQWQYIIKLDPKKRTVTVAPNEVMLSQIMAGSFVTYASSYNPNLKQFYLKTGYLNTSGNGRITEETLTLQPPLTGNLPVSEIDTADK